MEKKSPRSKVKVIVRVRPSLKPDSEICVLPSQKSLQIISHRNLNENLQYDFSTVYDHTSTQHDISSECVQPYLQHSFQGQNVSIFAYGPTGAGKTHTMLGLASDPGIIPRVIKHLFETINAEKRLGTPSSKSERPQTTIKFSYLDIYNEKVRDLLVSDSSDLPIREDAKHNIFVAGLKEEPIDTFETFKQHFGPACSNRTVAATKLNEHSSRSHSILLLKVHRRIGGKQYIGKIYLIDLAGSEDNRRTGNKGIRLKESGAINRSLFVLGEVVDAINNNSARIPYRNSKLTRLLQDSIGGNCYSVMVTNFAPEKHYYYDTSCTLNFASKSKKIVNVTSTTCIEENVSSQVTKPIIALKPNTNAHRQNSSSSNVSKSPSEILPSPLVRRQNEWEIAANQRMEELEKELKKLKSEKIAHSLHTSQSQFSVSNIHDETFVISSHLPSSQSPKCEDASPDVIPPTPDMWKKSNALKDRSNILLMAGNNQKSLLKRALDPGPSCSPLFLDSPSPAKKKKRKCQKSTKNVDDDCVYQALKETFLHSGKGRPKKLPGDLMVNNKLLVQLYHLIEEGNKAREVINLWLASIDPQVAEMNVTKFHFWYMASSMEKQLRSLSEMDHVHTFLQKTCSLEFISSSLNELGVNKVTFTTPPKEFASPPAQVTNKFVIELEQFRIANNLAKSLSAEWLMKLCVFKMSYPFLIIDKVLKKYDKLRKSKNRNPSEYNQFLNDNFQFQTNKDEPVSVPNKTCDKCTVLEKLHSTKVKEIRKLTKSKNDEAEVANALLLKEQCKNEDLINQLEFITNKHGSCNETVKVKELNKLKENCNEVNKSHRATMRKIKEEYSKKEKDLFSDLEIERKKVTMLREKILNLKEKNKLLKQEKEDAQSNLQKQMYATCIPIKGEKDNVYSDGMRKVVIALQSECGVSAVNVSKVIEIVSKELFDFTFIDKLPCKQTCINMCDEGYALSQMQIVENVLKSENVTLHSDGTSRDNKKIVGHQISLDNGDILCLGFVPVAGEDACTLLEITINILRQLCQTYCDLSNSKSEIDFVFKDILLKISSLMTDRAACMKLFDKKFQEFVSSEVGREIQVKFLHCNAHYLLGLASEVEKAVGFSEEMLTSETSHQLGRDLDDRFNRFSNTSESATNRVIRTVCDILGPRGDQKNGCRVEWTTYCEHSIIPSFKGNRFNCYFAAAAAIIFHLEKMNTFFNSGILHESPNLKIQSVALDLKDSSLMCFVCSVAIFYLKVTGPYWKLVNSPSVKYYDFHLYVKMMHDSFKTWSSNPDVLFDPSFTSIFNNELCIKSNAYNAVHEFANHNDRILIARCLQKMSEKALLVTERQLDDFLNGEFVNVDEDVKEILFHCPLTNLIGERCFGDFDFDMSKRRNATLHNRSALHSVSRNKTMRFLNKKHELSVGRLFKAARKRGAVLRQENRNLEKEVKNAVRAKFVVNQQKKIDKEVEDIRKRVDISEKVKKHGGPCESCEEIDALMKRLKSKSKRQGIETIKNEIRYHKFILGRKSLKFGTLEEMVTSLKNVFTTSAGPPAKRPRLCPS